MSKRRRTRKPSDRELHVVTSEKRPAASSYKAILQRPDTDLGVLPFFVQNLLEIGKKGKSHLSAAPHEATAV